MSVKSLLPFSLEIFPVYHSNMVWRESQQGAGYIAFSECLNFLKLHWKFMHGVKTKV